MVGGHPVRAARHAGRVQWCGVCIRFVGVLLGAILRVLVQPYGRLQVTAHWPMAGDPHPRKSLQARLLGVRVAVCTGGQGA